MASQATPHNPMRGLADRGSLLILAISVTALLLGVMVGRSEWPYVAVLALVPLVLRWPVEICLGSFVLLLPFESVTSLAGEGSRTLLWVAGALAAGVLLAVGLVGNRLQRPPRTALWLTLFVVWGAMSALWAVDQGPVLHRLPTAFSLLALYVVSAMFRLREGELRWIVALSIVGGCGAAILSGYQFYSGTYYGFGSYNSLRGTIAIGEAETNPNILAFNLLLPIAMATAQFVTLNKWSRKLLMLFAVGAIGLAIFLTMSRGGLIAMLVIVIVFAIRLRANRKLLAVAVLLSALMMAMPATFFSRLQGKSGGVGGAGRLYIWRVGWEIVKHRPLIGAGLDNFPIVYNQYAGYAQLFEGFSRDPHNIYLGVMGNLGIVGFLFLMLAVNSQRKLIKDANAPLKSPSVILIACEGVFWAALVFGLFGNTIFDKGFWLSWMMLAFAVRLAKDHPAPAPADEIDYLRQRQRYSPISLQL